MLDGRSEESTSDWNYNQSAPRSIDLNLGQLWAIKAVNVCLQIQWLTLKTRAEPQQDQGRMLHLNWKPGARFNGGGIMEWKEKQQRSFEECQSGLRWCWRFHRESATSKRESRGPGGGGHTDTFHQSLASSLHLPAFPNGQWAKYPSIYPGEGSWILTNMGLYKY